MTHLTTGSTVDCATSCGASYEIVGLLEPDSPPATCMCINAATKAELGASVPQSNCNSVFGSRSGAYVSVFTVV